MTSFCFGWPMLAVGFLGPFGILALAIFFVLFLIVVLRIHAYLALMLSAFLVGFLSPEVPGAVGENHFVRSVEISMIEFGKTAGNIGFVIALASIIGICLMESGAADKIVRVFLSLLGERRAGTALMSSGFVLGVPVFFDTVFFLLVPLARALSLRAGKDYLFYVLAICAGGVITHSVVAPTPGPLFMVEALGLDLGASIVVGVAAGLLPAVGGYWVAKSLNSRWPISLREAPGMPLDELATIVAKPDRELPPFWLALLPVALPVVLIATESVLGLIGAMFPAVGAADAFRRLYRGMEFLGNKNIALLIGALIALWLLARQKELPLSKLGEAMGPSLETAGLIILITSAGGAFGAMINHAGVGEAIQGAAAEQNISLVLLAWGVASVLKIAQGSGTVAMITTAGMMGAVVGDGTGLSVHPMYLFLAIGFGSLMVSWMNDSGFWVVGKLSGFTEQETLKTWTVLLAVISLIGLIQVLLVSSLFPLVR